MSRTHKHLLIDGLVERCPTNTEDTKAMLKDIISAIDMTLADIEGYTNPIAWYCQDLGNEGMTGIAILTTSHVSVHFWEDTKEIHFDLYSCKDYNVDDVIRLLNGYFTITGLKRANVINRGI